MVAKSPETCQSERCPEPAGPDADRAEAQAGARARAEARPAWKRELGRAFTDAPALLAALDLHPEQVPDLDPGAPDGFRLLVPRGFAALMTPGNPADPLLRQVLPLGAERHPAAGFVGDPVGDAAAARAPQLLQKYRGRALLIAHGACAVHCRYCFRRHYDYAATAPGRPGAGPGAPSDRLPARLVPALEALAADASLSEVILSGGDPLMLDDGPLAALVARLDALPGLARLRLHTRLPVVLPERVTEQLSRTLAETRLRVAVVIHANHPRELGDAAAGALARLAAAGATLLNQSVLLAGVNDSADTLADLSERLFARGVLPYYLHALDPVAGAAHFAVCDATARTLVETLRARLPGYLVPRLVRERPGAPYKQPLA